MQARQVARELALLSQSQLSSNLEKLAQKPLQDVVLAAIRTLTTEIHDSLETAAGELKRSNERLLSSETRTNEVESAKVMVKEAIELTQTSINRLGTALEMPEFIQLANQKEVRAYTLEILTVLHSQRSEIDTILNSLLVDWQLNRLPRIDQDILRIAVAEMEFIGLAEKMAINEAVELAKRYSAEDGHRFINGVLRRVSDLKKV